MIKQTVYGLVVNNKKKAAYIALERKDAVKATSTTAFEDADVRVVKFQLIEIARKPRSKNRRKRG